MQLTRTEIDRASRLQKSYISKLYFYDPTKGEFTKCDIVTLRNISASGLLFNYDRIIPYNTHLKFKIMLPFSGHVSCYGQVRRIDRLTSFKKDEKISVLGIAVKFTKIDYSSQHLIDYFIHQYLSGFKDGRQYK